MEGYTKESEVDMKISFSQEDMNKIIISHLERLGLKVDVNSVEFQYFTTNGKWNNNVKVKCEAIVEKISGVIAGTLTK